LVRLSLRAEASSIIAAYAATGRFAQTNLGAIARLLVKELLPFQIAAVLKVQDWKIVFDQAR
jgi:hypothetical protein